MSTVPVTDLAPGRSWVLPSRGRVGMSCLIVAESAIFTIFVVAYIYNIGKSLYGPTPRQVLDIPIFNSICLLSSSVTIMIAEHFLEKSRMRAFTIFWSLTFILGAIFLVGTGIEWHKLIYHDGLTISTNLFGTTFYSLVGLHASHVVIGLCALLLVLVFALAGKLEHRHAERVQVLALYWHFVDT